MRITLVHEEDGYSVSVDGVTLDPGPSQEIRNHSPGGFAWGYGGSGPAQLALAILLHAGVEDADTDGMYHDFKFEHLAGLPQTSCEFEVDVDAWVDQWRSRQSTRVFAEHLPVRTYAIRDGVLDPESLEES